MYAAPFVFNVDGAWYSPGPGVSPTPRRTSDPGGGASTQGGGPSQTCAPTARPEPKELAVRGAPSHMAERHLNGSTRSAKSSGIPPALPLRSTRSVNSCGHGHSPTQASPATRARSISWTQAQVARSHTNQQPMTFLCYEKPQLQISGGAIGTTERETSAMAGTAAEMLAPSMLAEPPPRRDEACIR